MNNRIKALQEQAGAKTKEIRALLDTAGKENRAITTEENTKLTGIEAEIADLQTTIDAEMRSFAAEARRSPRENLSKREVGDLDSFDMRKFLRHLAGEGEPLEGIELEMVQEGAAERRSSGQNLGSGLMLPRKLLQRASVGYERRDMTATGTTSVTLDQGGMTIATEKKGLLDALYNAQVLREAGAQFMTGVVGNFDWPRYVAGANQAHKAENVAADETSPTTLMKSFTPHRLPTYVDLSDQLLMQSSENIEMVVRRNLLEQTGALIEGFAIHGTGNSNQPEGILATTGIGDVAMGTNGGLPTLAKLVALKSKISFANAMRGSVHWLSNWHVAGELELTPRIASTDSRTLWDSENPSGRLLGFTPLWTNSVSNTLSKGSSGAVASPLIFGNFADLVMAFWSGISFEIVRDKTLAIAGMRTLVLSVYYDAGVIRPASFAAIKDMLTTSVN
jgi:HK97 family phage major capsid protein